MSFRKVAAKDPNAVVPYQFDWTDYFKKLGDTLDSADVDVVDPTSTNVDPDTTLVVVTKTQTADGVVTVYLSGGTPGVDHYVRCRVRGVKTTPAQTVDERTMCIPIQQT